MLIYQYRVDDPASIKIRAKNNPDVKDFKKLNKVVLAEGATNAMVSGIILFEAILMNVSFSYIGKSCSKKQP